MIIELKSTLFDKNKKIILILKKLFLESNSVSIKVRINLYKR